MERLNRRALRLYGRKNFISDIRVYPTLKMVDIELEIDCKEAMGQVLRLNSPAFGGITKMASLKIGGNQIEIKSVPLKPEMKYWTKMKGIYMKFPFQQKI